MPKLLEASVKHKTDWGIGRQPSYVAKVKGKGVKSLAARLFPRGGTLLRPEGFLLQPAGTIQIT
jgi:hypothetical protein